MDGVIGTGIYTNARATVVGKFKYFIEKLRFLYSLMLYCNQLSSSGDRGGRVTRDGVNTGKLFNITNLTFDMIIWHLPHLKYSKIFLPL